MPAKRKYEIEVHYIADIVMYYVRESEDGIEGQLHNDNGARWAYIDAPLEHIRKREEEILAQEK